MLHLLLLLILPSPPPADRSIVYDVATLPLARSISLQGTQQRYRVAVASTADEDGPTVGYDVEAPAGQHATLRLPALPIGHQYPDEFEVEGVLQVVRHPAREINGAFTEYRIVGKMVRPVPPIEDDGERDGPTPGLVLPKPDA